MATTTVADQRDLKALDLFARCADWQQGHTKDGRSFFAIPGSEPHLYHMADARECSCPDFQRAGNLCKHARAVRLWLAAYRTGAVAPKRPAPSTLDDDRVALLPAGAATLAEQGRAASAWHPCTAGCGELLAPEHSASLCDHCAAKAMPRARRTYAELFAAELIEA